MYSDLRGKVALVTGASQGIGRAIALALADEGVDVAVNFRESADLAEQVALQIRGQGRRSAIYKADVANRDAVLKMVQAVVEDFGFIDILVNNAGGISGWGISLEKLALDRWMRAIDVNLHGLFYCCQAVGLHLVARKTGCVINIASSAAVRPPALWGSYGVSKAAVIALTRQLALEWASSNIRVNCIAPGLIETPTTAGALADPEFMVPRLRGIPMARPGKAEEIASVALFLASKQSSYMTGQTLAVDGGETDYWPELAEWAKRRSARITG